MKSTTYTVADLDNQRRMPREIRLALIEQRLATNNLTPEDVAKAYRDGLDLDSLIELTGVSQTNLYRMLDHLQVPRRVPGRTTKRRRRNWPTNTASNTPTSISDNTAPGPKFTDINLTRSGLTASPWDRFWGVASIKPGVNRPDRRFDPPGPPPPITWGDAARMRRRPPLMDSISARAALVFVVLGASIFVWRVLLQS